MTPHLEIFTKRLQLRLPGLEEIVSFSNCIINSPSLHQWLDWCHMDFSPREAREFISANRINWIKGTSYGFAIYSRDNAELLGMVALTEIHNVSNMGSMGYWIADKQQHNGYAREALDALVEFSFDKLRLTRLEIVCDPDNIPSHKVAEACGAVCEGIGRNRFIFEGKARDGLVYSVIPQ